ncbi:IS1634 family transposase [candidate division KSB1 bacterium]|nr:IS1634 family transposase [candidate division KSB1 bacterium]
MEVYTTMASLQQRISGGYKYWYIVESRRVNGKPRPIPLLYLGKADDILKRLQGGICKNIKCKSFSHGAVAALLRVADDIEVIDIINKYVPKNKKNGKQLRDGLTVGGSLTLRAIERVCHPCSNREFYTWAKTTSLEYLLRVSCAKMDSQHFWDQMDELPVSAIPKIEEEIVKRVIEIEDISLDTLLLDATNFFTFINTTNDRCSLAQRGKNKKGRNNLRQVGILLVVSRKDIIPLFHETYEGNKADSKIFASTIKKITDRLCEILSDLEGLTLVFDRGNNSKSNLSEDILKIRYVGALSPSQHKDLMKKAIDYICKKEQDRDDDVICFRVKQELWNEVRTLIVYRSKKLYEGQLRGIEKNLKKKFEKLDELNKSLSNPRCKKRMRKDIIESIKGIVKGQFVQDIITWKLPRKRKHYRIEYGVDDTKFEELKKYRLGYRILMTDRHEWTDKEIMAAYHGQSKVEYAFKNLENPYHGSAHPQFHWTDQKIRVHVFTCVLGFLFESVIYRRAQKKKYGQTNYDNLFDRLERVRLASLIEDRGKRKQMDVHYTLEETEPEDELLLDALGIRDFHIKRPRFKGLVVYK